MIRFRRITSSGRFIPEIDGLRFVAIASVVLYHFHGFVQATGVVASSHDAVQSIAQHGYRGVNLFYVISGFILGLPFAAQRLKNQRPVSLKAYFLRRLTRLEPPYLVNLVVCFALAVLLGGGGAGALLPHLAASAAYVHDLVFTEHSPVNPVTWTLAVEVQFYCLAPVLALIFAVRSKAARRVTLVGAILLAGALQLYFWETESRAKFTILFAIQFFLAGFLLADVYLLDWDEKPGTDWKWDVVSVAGWPLLFALDDRGLWLGLPLLSVALYMAAFRGVVTRRVFRNDLVTAVGGMCYTIYLYHYVLIAPLLQRTREVHWGGGFNSYFVVQGLIYFAVLGVVSCLFFIGIERPCMAKRWWVRGA